MSKSFFVETTLSFIVVTTILGACGGTVTNPSTTDPSSGGNSSSSSSSPSSGIGTLPASNIALSLQLDSQWESETKISSTIMPSSSCRFLTTDAVPGNKICHAYIPEAQAFYSKLTFTLASATGWNHQCDLVFFNPFVYMASTGATLQPWWATTVPTCNPAAPALPPAECYGGVAKYLITGFPQAWGAYFIPADTETSSWTMSSSLNQAALKTGLWGTNNSIANTLVDKVTPRTFTHDGYVGGSAWQDYSAQCYDKWGQLLYSITLIISDDATASGYVPPPGYVQSGYHSKW